MQTTVIGEKRNSNMQLMGDIREPMAAACWRDANRIAENYAKCMQRDFWILFAAKPHVHCRNALINAWEVVAKKPSCGIVGVIVFKWVHRDKQLIVETDITLPCDIPLSEGEMSSDEKDFVPTVHEAAKKSNAILLA